MQSSLNNLIDAITFQNARQPSLGYASAHGPSGRRQEWFGKKLADRIKAVGREIKS